jgi:hypothetical protein
MRIVNYGGGLNSTALIVEAVRRGERIDHVVFADTGSEKPDTYTFMETFARWLASHELTITVVRWIRQRGEHAGEFVSVHQQCLERGEFPSVTYGLKGCTTKWKQQPLDKYVRGLLATVDEGEPVERWLGFDADEPGRWTPERWTPERWTWRAPLIEWDMGRTDCRRAIEASGLPLPPRSSCFICRNMRAAEVRDMAAKHPETMATALEIERRALANLSPDAKIAGLGGSVAWVDVVKQQSMFTPAEEPCAFCWDGEA